MPKLRAPIRPEPWEGSSDLSRPFRWAKASGTSAMLLGPLTLVLGGLATGCSESPKHVETVAAPTSNVPAGPAVDRSKCSESGKRVVTADTNQDQKPDVWKFFATVDMGGQKVDVLTCKQVDLNHDGRVDIVYYYDDRGSQTDLEQFDLDFDGKFDLTVYYAAGKKVREELDTNYDGRVDLWKYFEDEKLVRIERDTNGDGKVDEWQYYEGGKLDRIGYDINGDGNVDRWDRAAETEEGPGEGAGAAGGGGAQAPGGTAAPAGVGGAKPATTPPPSSGAPAGSSPPAASNGGNKTTANAPASSTHAAASK